MKTFDAYRVQSSEENVLGYIWYDGERLRATAKRFVNYVREQAGDKDDKQAWMNLPDYYRSGYTYVTKTKVDETGKEV